MLNGRNVLAKHRCKKLEDKILEPFQISSVASILQYCKLQLPDSWNIYLVLNIALLEYNKRADLKQKVIKIEVNGNDWVVESVIASRPSDDNPKLHVYLVRWKDF
jgi:hypothetical protein